MPEDSGSRFKSPAYCPMFGKLRFEHFRPILLKFSPKNVNVKGLIFQRKEIKQQNQKYYPFS